MFYGAKINTIDMGSMNFEKVTEYKEMFDGFQGNEIIFQRWCQ